MHQKLLTILKNNYMVAAFIFLGIISFVITRQPQEPEKQEKQEKSLPEPKSVDTFIPRGFVLVPIEIANAESLNSMVGDLGGVVDLYLATTEKQKSRLKVGSKLKLIRAPLNPQQYAVLVPDNESSKLMSLPGPYIAVIQNPIEKGTKLSNAAPSSIHVQYQN